MNISVINFPIKKITTTAITADQGNISFIINASKRITVFADEFNGDTPDFNLTNAELENMASLTLESTSYGKIIFGENVNLTQDVVSIPDVYNQTVNLDAYVEISSDFIQIDTGNLTSFAKSATIYFYDLNFNNPKILKDGEDCPDNVCTIISYTSGVLIFATTQFSNYSVGEYTSVENPIISPTLPGGGGGGAGAKKITDFSVNKDLVKKILKQGETERVIVEIINTGNTVLEMNINSSLERFMVISEESFSLMPGQVKIISIDVFAKKNEFPDAYIGRIIVKGANIEKIINVIIEIQERKPLFDVRTDVLTKELKAGEDVWANISVINMGDLENMDIEIYYAIKDFEENILSYKKEDIFIEKELEVSRKLNVPKETSFGAYVFYSRVTYGNISASSTDVFLVTKKKLGIFVVIIVTLVLFIIVGYYLIKINFKKKKKRK